MDDIEDFEQQPVRQADAFNLNLDGWEGPLDLLLDLARRQKVDLRRISILEIGRASCRERV